MFEPRSERRGIPGGLRAQLLAGLVVLVVGTMALVGLIGSHLARSQIERNELERTSAAVERLAAMRSDSSVGALLESMRKTEEFDFAEIAAPDSRRQVGDITADARTRLLDQLDGAPPERPTVAKRRISGTPHAVALIRPEGAQWHALVAHSLEEAHGRIERARKMLLAYLGIDALFILIVGYAFLTYVVVRPIQAIRVATERAARGDLASPIETQPPNEFGAVARSFNHMLDEIRENRRELEAKIEELDAAYTELEETQESLIRSEKLASVGQLAAGVAHEIGNPLSAVSGYLEMLEEGSLDEEERRDAVARMSQQLDRIQTIVRDLLDFARDEENRPVEPTDLGECVATAVDLLAPQPRARNIEVTTDIPDDLPKVSGVEDEVVQVLINLLMNAADAIDASETNSGVIEVSARATDTTVEVAVADDGPGIPPDEQNRIFDPFYTTKPPGEGTGLGLAIAHRIMERYDGRIEVDSQPDAGTTFTLVFPTPDT